MHQDSRQRFIIDARDIRGEIVHLSASIKEICSQQPYPPAVRDILIESVACISLLASILKFSGYLVMHCQIESGPIKLLSVKCSDKGDLSGVAQWDATEIHTEDSSELVGSLVITLRNDAHAKPYQSMVPLKGRSVTEALNHYFVQSVQLPSVLATQVNTTENDISSAHGVLLQQLPPKENQTTKQVFSEWVNELPVSIKDVQLENTHNICETLFPTEEIKIYTAENLQFGCQCTHKRMENSIRSMGKEEAMDCFVNRKEIEVTCEFCGRHHCFTRSEVEKLF